MRASRTVLIGLALIALVAVPSVAIGATTGFTLTPPVTASSASPFADCEVGAVEGADPPSINYLDTEVEPFVAVNPIEPDNIIGVYQQDRWSDGGAHGLVASRSSDGGATWTQNYAEFSVCSDYGVHGIHLALQARHRPVGQLRLGRPRLPDLARDRLGQPRLSGVEVATSTDDGATWNRRPG